MKTPLTDAIDILTAAYLRNSSGPDYRQPNRLGDAILIAATRHLKGETHVCNGTVADAIASGYVSGEKGQFHDTLN